MCIFSITFLKLHIHKDHQQEFLHKHDTTKKTAQL